MGDGSLNRRRLPGGGGCYVPYVPEKVTRIESDSNLRERMKEREGGPIFTECLLWAGVVFKCLPCTFFQELW